MPTPAEAIAARARQLVGAPFRLQGRSRDGVDCIGVVVHALGLPVDAAPRDYSLRYGEFGEIAAGLGALGFRACREGAEAPGDVLVFRPGPEQLHLGISTGEGFVHADAGLRRVVERPFPAPWPVLARWRAGDRTRRPHNRRCCSRS